LDAGSEIRWHCLWAQPSGDGPLPSPAPPRGSEAVSVAEMASPYHKEHITDAHKVSQILLVFFHKGEVRGLPTPIIQKERRSSYALLSESNANPLQHDGILRKFLPHSDDLAQPYGDEDQNGDFDYYPEEHDNEMFTPSNLPPAPPAPESEGNDHADMAPTQDYSEAEPNPYDDRNKATAWSERIPQTSQSEGKQLSLKRKASTDAGEENDSEDTEILPPSKRGSRKQAAASPNAPKQRNTKKPPAERQPTWIIDKIHATAQEFADNPETHYEEFYPVKPLWHHLSAFLGNQGIPPEQRPNTDAGRDQYVQGMSPDMRKLYLQYEGEERFKRDLRESKAQKARWAFLTRSGRKWVDKRPTTGPNAPRIPVLSDYLPAPDS